MKGLRDSVPILTALRHLRSSPDYSTSLFYLVIFVISLFLVFLPLSHSVQLALMKKFHLRSSSFGQWALLQLIPSMYNFANEVWITYEPLTIERIGQEDWPEATAHLWLNHYPLRPVTFGVGWRGFFFEGTDRVHVYARSRYRGQELFSTYRFVREGNAVRMFPVLEK